MADPLLLDLSLTSGDKDDIDICRLDIYKKLNYISDEPRDARLF